MVARFDFLEWNRLLLLKTPCELRSKTIMAMGRGGQEGSLEH